MVHDHVLRLHESEAAPLPPVVNHELISAVVVAEQAMSRDEGGVVMLGAVVSDKVNVALVVEVRPQRSVAVNVVARAPEVPQALVNVAGVGEYDQVNVVHKSLATPPPLDAIQAVSALVFAVPVEQATVLADATEEMMGAASVTVNVTALVTA